MNLFYIAQTGDYQPIINEFDCIGQNTTHKYVCECGSCGSYVRVELET